MKDECVCGGKGKQAMEINERCSTSFHTCVLKTLVPCSGDDEQGERVDI